MLLFLAKCEARPQHFIQRQGCHAKNPKSLKKLTQKHPNLIGSRQSQKMSLNFYNFSLQGYVTHRHIPKKSRRNKTKQKIQTRFLECKPGLSETRRRRY
jgi:hypothetical protein